MPTSEAHIRAVAKYKKKNSKTLTVLFSKIYESDLLEHLEKQENKCGYIKELIKKDMKKNKED